MKSYELTIFSIISSYFCPILRDQTLDTETIGECNENQTARSANREIDTRPIERQTTTNDYITRTTAATLELVRRVLLRPLVLTHLRWIRTTRHASLQRQQS